MNDSGIRRFEDFLAWQKARSLTASVYRITNGHQFSRDFALRDQMRRAAVSVCSNIAEGFERGRASEFHQFRSIAKASCAELRTQFYVALDVGFLQKSEFEDLMNQGEEVGRLVGGLRASAERRRDRPS